MSVISLVFKCFSIEPRAYTVYHTSQWSLRLFLYFYNLHATNITYDNC